MDTISVNRFRDNLKSSVEQAISQHRYQSNTQEWRRFYCKRDDWEREQETFYILQNTSLMQQNAQKYDNDTIYIFAIGGHYDQF